MRTLQSWLDEYGESHRNPVNKAIHWVCVPLIMLSALGMLWSIPRPPGFAMLGDNGNWATFVVLLAVIYYAFLSLRIALGMLLVSVLMCALLHGLARLPWPLLWTSVAIFAGAWVGQFIGHKIEGKKPSFFKDLQFLLIGPAWLLAAGFRRIGLAY